MGCTRTPTWGGSVLSWLLVGIMITTGIWPLGCAGDELPEAFNYTNLWTSQDGETHIKQCKMQNFTLQAYALLPQYLKTDFGGSPKEMIFTQLSTNLTQGLHSTPAVQFVTTLFGSWYIKTTDGSEYTFEAGEVLFQDNVVTSPANKVPQHYSGAAGNAPCMQFIVQFNRTAQVDNPCPF